MRNKAIMLACALLLAGCADSPLGPEIDTEAPFASAAPAPSPEPSNATSSSYPSANAWLKVDQITTGVGVWIHTSNPTRVVIGLGAQRARELTYSGPSIVDITFRLHLLRAIAQYFGAPRFMGLEKNKKMLKRVRNGQYVGLWILMEMTPHRDAATNFRVLRAAQRPRGTHNPPAAWLWY